MNNFLVEPHGEYEIELLEDAVMPGNRIYRIQARHDKGVGINMLGEEIASLVAWWNAEATRTGTDEE